MAAVLAVGTILTAPGLLAAASAPAAREIGVSSAMRGDLRAAAVRYHATSKVTGPLAGSVRAARYGPVQWAIATFTVPGPGLAGQPELLRRRAGRRLGRPRLRRAQALRHPGRRAQGLGPAEALARVRLTPGRAHSAAALGLTRGPPEGPGRPLTVG